MVEVNGAKLGEDIASGGKLSSEMMTALGEQLKEFARGTTYSTTALSAMIEAMHKSRSTFQDFFSTLERTSTAMYSFARITNDVSQSLRGATSSVEGFIAMAGALTTKTLPDLVTHIKMASTHYGDQIISLQKTKEAVDKQIVAQESDMNGKRQLIEWYGKLNKRTEEQQNKMNATVDQLNDLASSTSDLKMASAKCSADIKNVEEKISILGTTMKTAFFWITLAVTAAIALAQAYDTSIKAKREVIYTLGRMGVSYGDNIKAMDAFNNSFTAISIKWGVFREDMAKALAPLTGLGIGVGKGGAETSFKSGVLGKTMTVVEDWTGAMMRLGTDAGVTSRAFGVLGTAMNISGDTLGDTFGKLAALGEKSVLGQQRYINETISMLEITRKYGGEIEGAQVIVSAFGEGIKKGTYSLEAMSRLVTPAMWSSEQKGAMASLMRQFAPTEAGQLGIKGKDIFADMMALERAGKDKAEGGNPEVLAKAIQKTLSGMTSAGMSTEQQAFMMQAYLKDLTGAQVSTLEAMKIFADPVKFAAMINPPKADTPQQVMEKALKAFGLTETVGEKKIVSAIEGAREGVLALASDKGKSAVIGAVGTAVPFLSGITSMFSEYKFVGDAILQYIKSLSKKGKQTGGYISEEGEYLLHAGEQVRRPGEGTGGNVNVSLGGMSVSIGDRGDMGSQINEAFDRIKQETIKEIEQQWEKSLHAH